MVEKRVIFYLFLSFLRVGDALKCYQNANGSKILAPCDATTNYDRCVAGKFSVTVSVGERDVPFSREIFTCTMSAFCNRFCELTVKNIQKNVPKINFKNCQSYCCTGDGCNKVLQQKESHGYIIAGDFLIVVFTLIVSFLWI
ncbi:uncharacterized protein LOC130614555 isoform X2 [Hydractinia symbiolongicarpus]|uniref:uncharacterized protein LOC130614555 isoform X2 n=1 Tax=Hydractinia symbiolongicarpus TaxID=13093 RepID=UPI00254B6040|nr:uncharacterized protein LOC130614555 isoform X2 [Hydractinia symbiolongicarpus]